MQRTLEPEVMDTPQEAEDYDAMDHSGPNSAFVDRLVDLGAQGLMLDVGTGPGHVPLLVCERVPSAHIIGIDLSKHMLDRAESKRRASPHAERIEFRTADAKGLDFDDHSFDVVFSNTILHHIPDPRDLLREARRVLKPGGCLLIRDLYRPESAERALELVAQHASEANAEQQELFRASLHAALTSDELREMAREVGLENCEVAVDSDRHHSLQRARTASTE